MGGGGGGGEARGIDKEKESTLSLGIRVENEISKTDEADCAGGRWWRWFYQERRRSPVGNVWGMMNSEDEEVGVQGPAAPLKEPGSREDGDGIERCTSPSVLVKVLRAVEAAAKNVSAQPSHAA